MEINAKSSNGADNTPIKELDIHRYLGTWYEIARYDHRFERGLTRVTATYSMNDDGTIKVLNSGFNTKKNKRNDIVGRAKLTDVPALLRVSFFWKFYSDYRVLALGEDYDWVLVGGGRTDKYLWILSRTIFLPDDKVKMIVAEAQKRGYDVSKLIFDNRKE